ncbi:MAG TPA: hypothetical protein VF889_06220 [Bacteroidota bacterium]
MIVRTAGHGGTERCLSPEYTQCPAAKQLHEELPSQARCPFLQESLVQYCSSAPVTTYIPYTESLLSRCLSGRFRYCGLYLAMAHPEHPGTRSAAEEVEGIPVPSRLCYTRNHLWLDVCEDGACAIGIDGLLAHVLASVDKVTYLTTKGTARPSAVLAVRGLEIQVAFPAMVQLTGVNPSLRTDPGKLIADPYGLGWMFEGSDPRPAGRGAAPLTGGLLRGTEAREWMRDEYHRMSAFIHEVLARPGAAGARIMNDGGLIGRDALQGLSPEEVIALCNEFFSLYASLGR